MNEYNNSASEPINELSNEEVQKPERLQKVMARVGIGSRRVSEGYIEGGRVSVNGKISSLGDRVSESDEIVFDGAVISTRPGSVAYLLNKPIGVVTTASDPQGRKVVVDLVPDAPRVFPVGRLDMDTEGLLLLTNDGELAHRLTHPSFGVEKEYLAHVEGDLSRSSLRHLREGVELDDGITHPAKATLVSSGVVKLTIHEGRNRQVRRMLDAIGHPVMRLARTRIGPIADPQLRPGASRKLDQSELIELQKAVHPTVTGE